ncbi:MAG: methyltransferase domain-containing protein [Humidesulfovibrio sp.]|jgi:SAM-dependent methyltransferase|uniref:methyltransferase domain-containing protein n=1 Tax=Humidesulfovibrio sp. TaxID=2910988 RepID=UPI00273305DE|nr:methyltransferase domain-containing protein [Humidesulfovibrio sp.]MDP2848950.1 methyltransferase domain-containing protein [Humidesulfovibrio sp.]
MQIDRFHIPQGDIENELLTRFRKAAISPQGLFDYPTGREGLRLLGYPHEFISSLPDRVAECYCGVGNPFAPSLPLKGEAVLDVGCGAGVDALAAATFVGLDGRVEGLEYSPDMLARAADNAGLCGAQNVSLQRGSAERLPYQDSSFDLLISNGVYNLVRDKPRALAEAFRILKPGGRVQLADQILEADTAPACPLPQPGALVSAAAWAR